MLNYNQMIKKIIEIRTEVKKLSERTDYEQKSRLLRHLKVYAANAEKLYILENMPRVIEIMNKYAGKKCGEKTNLKIQEEIKAAGIIMYFTFDTITFCPSSGEYYTVYTRYIDGIKQTITDDENKINRLSAEMFHLPERESVIKNVESFVARKEREFIKLKEKYNALEKACQDYNEDNPLEHIDIRKGIYWMD